MLTGLCSESFFIICNQLLLNSNLTYSLGRYNDLLNIEVHHLLGTYGTAEWFTTSPFFTINVELYIYNRIEN